jgi:threonylcarbamoyladenosine tRNA methylthiotransferase MtaB
MHRRYDTQFFADKVARVHELIPDAFIGVDVIVGTRGETDALFRDAHRFMEQLDVAQYHVFSYSERPGTKALQIPHAVRPEEKHERSQQILALSEAKLHIFYNRYARARRPVLLEHSHTPGIMHGFTDNYIRTEVRVAPDQPDNCIVQAELGPWNAAGDALTATLL